VSGSLRVAAAPPNPLGSGAVPPDLTYGDLVQDAAARHGEATALVLEDRRLSFAELGDLVDRAITDLAAAGVTPGDKVGVLGTNSPEWLATTLGAMATGAIAVPLNARDQAEGVAHALRKSEASHLFYAPRYARRELTGLPAELAARGWDGKAVTLDRERLAAAAPAAPGEAAAEPGGLGIILFTSGSTSKPKGCMLTQQGMIRNALLHTARLGITAGDSWFSPMPFFHAGGLVWGVSSMLVSGATLVSQSQFDAGKALAAIERERCTYHHGIDAMFVAEMSHPDFAPERVASLRIVNSTGSPKLLRTIRERMGIEGVVSKWGLSEGYGNLTLSNPDDPLEKRLDTVGRGYDGIDYRIADPDTGASLANERTGEIQVRGAAMEGYYRDPEATRAMFTEDGWLRSGDLGSFDDDGFLTYSGRLKEMLKVGGENVAIAEVEDALMDHPDVQLAVVVGAPHPRLAEVPVAYVVPRPGSDPAPAAVEGHARERLAAFKVPVAYLVCSIDDVPTTGSGKVQRQALSADVARLVEAGELEVGS
jgi:fatty-acyl-CoA synthase